MKVRILKWSYKGIRGINDLEISLEKNISGQPIPITLFMMPNGTGKTTTITLLRAVFDGTAESWPPSKVRDFKPSESIVKEGEFQATILINERIYVVFIKLDYDLGKAFYSTSRVGDAGGLARGHNLLSEAKEIFTQEFVQRFIFDGELANAILVSGRQEAEKAIRYLYQLNFLELLSGRIDGIVLNAQQKADNITSAKTTQGLNRLRSDRDRVNNALTSLTANLVTLQGQLQSKKDRLSEVSLNKSEHIKTSKDLREKAVRIEKQQTEINNKIFENSISVLSGIKNPYLLSESIATRLESLSQKMQQLKLPKTMSKQFFEELAEQIHCVCGTTIGTDEKAHILQRADDYLADDQIGVINAIKSAIKNRQYSDELIGDVSNLNKQISDRNHITNEWNKLINQRKASGDILLEELEKEEVHLHGVIEILKIAINIISTKDKTEQETLSYDQNIPLCQEELAKVEKKLAEATDTVKLLHRAKKTKDYLDLIEKEALEQIKKKILNATNTKIAGVIKNELISVERIDGHLSLKDKSGASAGQTLAIAYSFLGSLFESSSYELPFVVDSPAGALDLVVRRNVSVILPSLFEQLIVFITSGERDGFSNHFYKMNENVQFLTIYRENQNTAVCISGKDAFQKFQEEQDDEEIIA